MTIVEPQPVMIADQETPAAIPMPQLNSNLASLIAYVTAGAPPRYNPQAKLDTAKANRTQFIKNQNLQALVQSIKTKSPSDNLIFKLFSRKENQ